MRRRRGRPKLEPELRRKHRVQIAVTWEELLAVRRAAKAEDLSVSVWGRRRILDATKKA